MFASTIQYDVSKSSFHIANGLDDGLALRKNHLDVCGIYKITSPSGKVYVGQSQRIYDRWRGYKNGYYKNQPLLNRSILKYGIHNHRFEIVELCSTENLNALEKFYVEYYNSFNSSIGLNLRAGGCSNAKISDSTREKMRLKALGRIVSDETRKKIGEKSKGRFYSEETRNKISMMLTGRTLSDEHKDKLRKAHTGKKLTQESIAKRTLKQTGLKRSDDTKRKISTALKGLKRTPEQNAKNGIAHKGHKMSPENKLKLLLADTGRPAWNKGKKMTKKMEAKNEG